MIPKYNEFSATVRTPPLPEGAPPGSSSPMNSCHSCSPMNPPQGQASLRGIRHQAFLCRSGKKKSPSPALPLKGAPKCSDTNHKVLNTCHSKKTTTTADIHQQEVILHGSRGGGGVGGQGRDRGAGAAASHNWIPINWKELADKPWLKGNLGDLKTKTICSDLGIN